MARKIPISKGRFSQIMAAEIKRACKHCGIAFDQARRNTTCPWCGKKARHAA